MCGRFTRTFTWDQANLFLDISGPPLNLRPRHNVVPSQEAAVVRADRPPQSFDAALGPRAGMGQGPAHRPQAHQRTFGDGVDQALVPGRVRLPPLSDPGGRVLRMEAHERGEATLAYRHEESRTVRLRWPLGAPVRAGRRSGSDGDLYHSHDPRQRDRGAATGCPLASAAFGPWLACVEVALGPYPPEVMTAWPVSSLVNRPANDDASSRFRRPSKSGSASAAFTIRCTEDTPPSNPISGSVRCCRDGGPTLTAIPQPATDSLPPAVRAPPGPGPPLGERDRQPWGERVDSRADNPQPAIRTCDLQVMSMARYRTAPLRNSVPPPCAGASIGLPPPTSLSLYASYASAIHEIGWAVFFARFYGSFFARLYALRASARIRSGRRRPAELEMRLRRRPCAKRGGFRALRPAEPWCSRGEASGTLLPSALAPRFGHDS